MAKKAKQKLPSEEPARKASKKSTILGTDHALNLPSDQGTSVELSYWDLWFSIVAVLNDDGELDGLAKRIKEEKSMIRYDRTSIERKRRRVLVNHARDRARLKRGGGRSRVDLDRLTGAGDAAADDLLELDDALERVAQHFPVAAELVKLRFSAGMTLGDAADALGLPRRTADRHWSFARAWLADAIACG